FVMEEDSVSDLHLANQMADLKKQFIVLSHQMSTIVEALRGPLHLPTCACPTCVSFVGSTQLVRPANPVPPFVISAAALAATPSNGQSAKTDTAASSENGGSEDEVLEVTPIANGAHAHPSHTPVLQTLPNTTTNNIFADSQYGGRRSKYCDTPEEKRAVAEYAAVHGAANAAKKFNMPASVAAYYSRKLKAKEQMNATATALGVGMSPDALNGMDVGILTPSLGGQERTRGRPKMIGDKLDAELMEHMLKEKAENPSLEQLSVLRPEMAMEMAREFINKHSPMLLKENGGHVELKNSWANKLVARIAEREKEVALGLPQGTLNNVGLAGLKQLDSGAFMNDLNNILMMAQMQEGEIMPETPEITNIKVLSFSDFLGENNDGEMKMDE
ncbi:hypothetical protein PMAYCL1PPCAC_15232, partial [Pristionchus mayeri]